MSGTLGSIVDYQKFLGKDVLKSWKKDPERALLGINTPFESKVWGKVLGKDYEPTVDMFGGDTKQQQDRAAATGMRTGPGESMHDIARSITSLFAGGYGANALGAMGGTTSGATAYPVGTSGGPQIAGYATGGDPFVSASGGSLMGAPGSMGAAASSPSWMQYARMANMGSNLMGGGQGEQPQPLVQPALMSQDETTEFRPVYPGMLQPFLRG